MKKKYITEGESFWIPSKYKLLIVFSFVPIRG